MLLVEACKLVGEYFLSTLNLVNYFWKFIRDFVVIAKLLMELTKKGKLPGAVV